MVVSPHGCYGLNLGLPQGQQGLFTANLPRLLASDSLLGAGYLELFVTCGYS